MTTIDQLYRRILISPSYSRHRSLNHLWGSRIDLQTATKTLQARNEHVCVCFLQLVSQYIQTLEQYDKLLHDCMVNIYNNRWGFVRIRTDRGLTDGTIVWPQPPASVTIYIGNKACLWQNFKPLLDNGKVEFLQHGRDGAIDLVEEGKCRSHFSDGIGNTIMNSISSMPKELALMIADMISGKYDLEGYMTDLANNMDHQRALKAQADRLLNQSSTSSQ